MERAALAVAQSPDAGDGCFQPRIDLDETILVCFDAGFIETEIAGVWTAAGGDQEMRTRDARCACRALERDSHGAVFIFDACGAGIEQELDAFGFERFLQLGGNFGIFASNNLFAGVKNGDTAAEAAKHLAKFEANVTTSQNEQVIGNGGELHDGFVR